MLVAEPNRKYRIVRYLTEGGMGAIYLGKRLGAGGFEKEVVLKQLLPEFAARPEFRDLFFREARISATLDHVNIVRTYDLVTSDDAMFIVMEYVRGADLRTIAWRAKLQRRVLSPAALIHVALEIVAGLAYAHSRKKEDGSPLGVIHRDVSPSNILCSAQGDVKLSDFGIAKAATASSVFYRVRGKVGYMSPEQAANQPLDPRSDLFSLAVCLMETMVGERLYAGDLHTPPDIVYAARIPRLTARRPDLPFELEAVMDRALALRPDDRFADATAFAEALRDVARRHGLLYSASELAAELSSLLGPDADRWSQEDVAVSQNTDKLPLRGTLEGHEATPLAVPQGALPAAQLMGAVSTSRLFPADLPCHLPGNLPGLPPPRPAGRSAPPEEAGFALPDPVFVAPANVAATPPLPAAPARTSGSMPTRPSQGALPVAARQSGSMPVRPSQGSLPVAAPASPYSDVRSGPIAILSQRRRTSARASRGWLFVLVAAIAVGIGVSFLWQARHNLSLTVAPR